MGLFRRIFGKTSDESSTKSDVTKTNDENTEDVKSDNKDTDLDASTIPLPTTPLTAHTVADGVTRPLTPDQLSNYQDSVFSSQGETIAFGIATDVGKVRTNNQDAAIAYFISNHSADNQPDFGLFVVADGMGGHHDGEKASAITVRAMVAEITNSFYLPMLSTDNDADRIPITEALISSVQRANQEVRANVPDGGTTCTAVSIIGDLAHFAHVGDSRAYLITRDGLEQITRDHSLVQRLIELGQLTEEEAKDHPQKNVLYRALGQNESLEVDSLTRRLPSESRLLICSDGLWGLIEERDIFEVTMNTPDPQQACEKLIELANEAGGSDNITAIILKVSST